MIEYRSYTEYMRVYIRIKNKLHVALYSLLKRNSTKMFGVFIYAIYSIKRLEFVNLMRFR